ncbi:MAG: hypothetical protein E7Z92_06660 [Cyanobacteria bacterium SIG31]|nr:hypothetical protein [Cyanobacteria bacterium SIG31]
MKKYSKYILLAVCIIATLVAICFIPFNATKLIPTIEEQVAKDLGVNIHIEKLILRLGPNIKLKTPIMHLMYEDGQKFAQFNSVKFYIPWTALLKDNTTINKLKANKLVIRVNSDDKYLPDLIDRLQKKDRKTSPEIKINDYHIAYLNRNNNDKYSISGTILETSRIANYDSFKFIGKGEFFINSKKFINYDLTVLPKLNLPNEKPDFDFINFIEHLKELDFNSDIIADIKLYKNSVNVIQASGFVNIDNITVLDASKKGPKSFVYLTLWGDKASVLSNIYTSATKKVYIEGMVNNSQKPVLDIKVKTDEIELSELYKKLKILADFSVLKGINTVNGILNANFTLKGDLNKIKSNGYMKIKNASINASGLQIEKINSDIDFSNNAINIVEAIGYVKNSPIMAKGSVSKDINIEFLMSKVELKHLCPSFLGVKDGIASLVANFTGTFDNITHKEILQVDNLVIEKNNSKLIVDSIKIDTNKSSTAHIDNIVCNTPETETIKIPTLNILLEPECLKIPETNIFLPNSKLILNGDVTNYNNNDITFNTTLTGFINSKDIKRFNEKSLRYPLIISVNGNKNIQNINAQLLLESTSIFDEATIINLASKLEKNLLKLDDLSLSIFNGDFSNDYKLNLKGNKKLIITGFIEDIKNPVLKNLRIFIPQQLNINIFETLAQVKGDLFLNGKFNKPDIVGQLSIQNMFNQPTQLSLSNCTVDFNKNIAVVNAPLVKLADNSLGFNALVSTDVSDKLVVKNANIKSKFLNTETLLMYKDSPLLKLMPICILDGKLYSERLLANIYENQVYMSAFSSDFNINENLLNLKNITAEMFNGKLGGNINFNLKDEHFILKLMGRGVSAAPIFNIISTKKESISGIMDFDITMQGNLTSRRSLLGDIKFIINNGRMSTLGKLEHLLYAQNVIADNMLRTSLSIVTKAITLKDTGLFKFMRGEVNLDSGIAKIGLLQSQGPLMSLFIKGNYNIETDYAQLTVLGRLSDEIVTGLGAFGDFSLNKLMIMLTGEENNQVITANDIDKLPQLSAKSTKEFRSIINGIIDKPSSVILFNWISYTQKSLKQKEVPMTNTKLPSFVDELPY